MIYDDWACPETTGVYCLRALRRLVEVEHFQPDELERISRDGFDLFLNIDDGFPYHLPSGLRPCAWWAIDTHLNFQACLAKAHWFDMVFAAQRDGADALRRAGISSAAWLPLACDPEIHFKHEADKQYDVSFVGNVFPGPRADLLNLLRRKFPNSFIGQCYFEEMARTYSASRTVFNRSIKNDVNMRVFEALACGSLLITNELSDNGQAELCRDGVHLATYREHVDLLDKLAFYLAREATREKIASAGRARRWPDTPTAIAWSRSCGRRKRSCRGRSSDRRSPWLRLARHTGSGLFRSCPARSPRLGAGDRPERPRHRLGAGRLGEAVKARQETRVVGIELNEIAAAAARQRLDKVLVGDIERLDLDFPSGSFDAIVCGDILEHLRDPDRLLHRARGWLAADGRLVTSIPNVRHHSVVRSLLEGNWTYESAGLLDRTHLRFFTRREIEKLLFRAGFAVEELRAVCVPGEEEALNGHGGAVQVGRLCIGGLSPRDAAEYYTYQYLVRALPAEVPAFGLTSIVILTHNQLEYTRQCLESIRRLTDEPYELIVVDNASTDGTVDYLRAMDGVRLIVNEVNRGFPAAVNQGIAASRGSQVLLLNNDTVVTTGWLRRLLDALYSDPMIGLAGPCSNFVGGPQQVEVRYDSLSELDGFAWDWGRDQPLASGSISTGWSAFAC